MTPLELMKDGILTGNMDKVSQAYSILTGEILNRPQPAFDQTSAGSRMESKSKHHRGYDVEDFNMQIVNRNKTEGDGRRQARTEPINLNKIKNVGNMFEDVLDIDDVALVKDKPMYTKKPVDRREAPPYQKYRCNTCNDIYKLLPIHVALVKENEGIFTCDSCKRKNGGN